MLMSIWLNMPVLSGPWHRLVMVCLLLLASAIHCHRIWTGSWLWIIRANKSRNSSVEIEEGSSSYASLDFCVASVRDLIKTIAASYADLAIRGRASWLRERTTVASVLMVMGIVYFCIDIVQEWKRVRDELQRKTASEGERSRHLQEELAAAAKRLVDLEKKQKEALERARQQAAGAARARCQQEKEALERQLDEAKAATTQERAHSAATAALLTGEKAARVRCQQEKEALERRLEEAEAATTRERRKSEWIQEGQRRTGERQRMAQEAAAQFCALCFAESVETVALPCGHAYACRGCAEATQTGAGAGRCGICRSSVNSFHRIHWCPAADDY